MSVVNRMLQDIDRRRIGSGINPASAAHLHDLRSIPMKALSRPRSHWRAGIVAGLAVLGVAVCAWAYLSWQDAKIESRTSIPAEAPPVLRAENAHTASAPSASHLNPPETNVKAETTAASAETSTPNESANIETFRLSRTISLSAVPDRHAPAPSNSLPAPSTATTGSTVGGANPKGASVGQSRDATSGASQASTPSASGAIAKRVVATEETIRTARSYWVDGWKASAFATLREAIAAAEMSGESDAVGSLAKELARLELNDSRADASIATFRRYQQWLGADADAWALRANAEQRIASHDAAAISFGKALALRPSEGRWMVGLAISLAATGRPEKMEEASRWASTARESGALTPTLAAYLRELGVPIK